MYNNQDRSPQLTVTGTARKTRNGGEAITFDIDLALLRLHVVAIIPDDDTDEAPVYVHFRIKGPSDSNGKRQRTRRDAPADGSAAPTSLHREGR